MDIRKARDIFLKLFHDINGYKIAKEAQEKSSYFYQGNIYGEVTFDAFYQILLLTAPKNGEIFYDFGSGTGKPSFIAHLCFNFTKVVGVEEVSDLYESSKKTITNLQQNYPEIVSGEKSGQKIDFLHSDFKNLDFSDANVIFMNSYTYFYYEIFNERFIGKLNKLKKGTRIITTVMPINLPYLRIKTEGPFIFTWGDEFVHIHEKTID